MKNHTWVSVQGRGFNNATRCVLNNQYTVDPTLTYLLSPTSLQVTRHTHYHTIPIHSFMHFLSLTYLMSPTSLQFIRPYLILPLPNTPP